jgi:hypothetical protein
MLIIVVILVCVSLDVSYQELDGSFFFTVFLDSPISTHANKKFTAKTNSFFTIQRISMLALPSSFIGTKLISKHQNCTQFKCIVQDYCRTSFVHYFCNKNTCMQ